MIQKVFSVRDGKALAFLQPFFSTASGSAIRAFSDAVQDVKTPLGAHPEDYVLYEIGTFDDSTAVFECLSPIKLLGAGMDFVIHTASRQSLDTVSLPHDKFAMEMMSDGKK